MAKKKTQTPAKAIPATKIETPPSPPVAAATPPSVMVQIETTQAQVLRLRDEWIEKYVPGAEGTGPEPMRWAFSCLKRWEALEELKKTFLREADMRAFFQGKLDELLTRRKELAAIVAVPIQPERTPVESKE